MVSMDRENGQVNAQSWFFKVCQLRWAIPEIDCWIAQELEVYFFWSEAIFPQQINAPLFSLPGRLVLMEQITSQENQISFG